MPNPGSPQPNQTGTSRKGRLASYLAQLDARLPAWPLLSFVVVLAFGIADGLPPMGLVPRVLALALFGLIGAVFLRFSARAIFKLLPPPKMAIYAMLVAYVPAPLLFKLAHHALYVLGQKPDFALALAIEATFLIAQILVVASILALMVRMPDSTPLGFRRACVLTIVMFVVSVLAVGFTFLVLRLVL
jgi:hypothetical protein